MLRRKRNKEEAPNLLHLIPEKLVESDMKDDGLAYLVVPKFRGKHTGKWLTKRMRHPTWKLDLDEVGTYVWDQIDGKSNVEKIGNKMKEHFGDNVEPVYDRLNLFLYTMRREDLIRFVNWQAE
jgi:hypothetical protein